MLVRIATRQSPLALWQAEHVKAALQAMNASLTVTLVPLTTSGDLMPERSLAQSGGKGLFVKELEEALRERRADIAVHSMKDVPAAQPAGLSLAAFLPGEDPRDAFVSARFRSLRELPQGARVGTSSLRRQAQLRAERPDIVALPLRGNVGTRLKRLDEGRFDAILLACAGLVRLGEARRITEALEVARFVPAIGQGIIGIECREDDHETRQVVSALNDPVSATPLAAERALNAKLGGHAIVTNDLVQLTGLVAAPDGSRLVRDHVAGPAARAAELGAALGERLLDAGGAQILRAIGVAV
jgi:hydroxymethylbilane synthase